MAVEMGSCINYGVGTLKRNPLYAIVGLLIAFVLGSFSFSILQWPLLVGYIKGLRKEDRGEKAEIGDVFSGFDSFVPALVAGLLSIVIINIGFILCIIPGLLLAPMLPVALAAVADGEKDGVAALKKGFEAVKANLVPAALTNFVLGLIGAVGGILCGVGALITLPIAFGGSVLMADQMGGGAAPAADAGPDATPEPTGDAGASGDDEQA